MVRRKPGQESAPVAPALIHLSPDKVCGSVADLLTYHARTFKKHQTMARSGETQCNAVCEYFRCKRCGTEEDISGGLWTLGTRFDFGTFEEWACKIVAQGDNFNQRHKDCQGSPSTDAKASSI